MGKRVVIVGQYMEGIEIERGVLEPIGAEIVDTRDFSEEETNEAMRTADAVLFRKLGVTRELINSLDNCKIICTYAAGYDAIDVEAATERKIMVANTPGYGNDEVADHTLMLLFALDPQADPAGRCHACRGEERRRAGRLDAPALHADPAHSRPDARHHRIGAYRQDGRAEGAGTGAQRHRQRSVRAERGRCRAWRPARRTR